MIIEHDLAMKNLTRKVDEFIKVFGKEDFKNRYQVWSERNQLKIGWTCLPTNLANRLHGALEKAIAAVPPEEIGGIQKPKSTKTKRKTKAKPVEAVRDLPLPATADMEVGAW